VKNYQTVWNSLPEDIRDPEVSEDSYRQSVIEDVFICTVYYSVSQKIPFCGFLTFFPERMGIF